MEFVKYPKTARGYGPVVFTEKLDGANAGVHVYEEDGEMFIGAQSRNRLVCVGDDSTGIAQWVEDRKDSLVSDLGLGVHFGEFVKRKSNLFLFNTARWKDVPFTTPGLHVVPVLYEGDYYEGLVPELLDDLRNGGSRVLDSKPEGVIGFLETR